MCENPPALAFSWHLTLSREDIVNRTFADHSKMFRLLSTNPIDHFNPADTVWQICMSAKRSPILVMKKSQCPIFDLKDLQILRWSSERKHLTFISTSISIVDPYRSATIIQGSAGRYKLGSQNAFSFYNESQAITTALFATSPIEFRLDVRAEWMLPDLAWKQWNGLHIKQHPFDVCFRFADGQHTLWEDSKHLSLQSTYWESITQAGFAECTAKQTNAGCDRDYIVLKIESTEGPCTFDAYRSILNWTRTNVIKFGPLQDPQRPSKKTTDSEGVADNAANSQEFDGLADPLTVYEICKYIELEDLAAAALDDFAEKLTVDNVLHHLFSSTLAWQHQELRQKIFQFYAKNQRQEDTTLLKHLQVIRGKIELDDVPIPLEIAASLMADLAIVGFTLE